jgi:branched-chain amino acid transport system substrate-binding protein
VFDRGIPGNTTDYTLLVNNVEASHPDAFLEFGYPANEIAFLRALQDNGSKFKFLFTGYGLTEMELMQTNGVADQLMNTYALAGPAAYPFKPQTGQSQEEFKEGFEKWVVAHHNTGVEFGFNALAGYQAGLVIENALAEANSLDQLELRRAVFTLSGKLVTLDGRFVLAPDGSQSGEILPLGQIIPGKKGAADFSINIVWPPDLTTAKPLYPAP